LLPGCPDVVRGSGETGAAIVVGVRTTRNSIRLLLLGAPGSGKGTQGVRLAERYQCRHISTGELLRAQVAAGTDVGLRAQPFMERGDLVPDDLILLMVLDELVRPDSPPSFVLDGFPRTVAQAEAAYEQAVGADRVLDAVVCLDIDHDELLERLEQRGREAGRADDNEATIRHRIEEYEEKTLPLLDYYAGRDMLVRVDAVGDVDVVTRRIFAALDGMVTRPGR
jgi:adenylate kinase